MPADPKRVKEIFLAVSDAADDRAALLDRECGGDADLRQRVEALLHAHHDPATFLRQRPESTVDHRPLPGLLPGQMFDGRFKLREELGHGGMGVVFVADQTEPVQRRVALKVIREGGDTTRLLARFEQERQALALMDHPNIAKVFDAGVSDAGQPYFVMELIKGMPITDYCDKAKLTPRERLELFVPVCHAVQHAHQKGVIHRDLKPSNILVGLYDGRPVPKVIDFGVAKATGQRLSDASVYTEVGSVIGTLEYMSPEQAELNNLDIDTRSDVYALGVILYQLLTGTVPFTRQELQSRGFAEMLRIIKEKEPPRPSNRLSTSQELPLVADLRRTEPSKLSKLVRGELDWIVMKALEKDRTRRYETANGFAADVQRYLSGDAVEACPPTLGYRLRKVYRRNRSVILTAGALAAMLLVATCVSLAFGVQAKQAQHLADASTADAIESRGVAQRERDEATAARDTLAAEQQKILRLDYSISMRQANMAWKEHRFPTTRALLDRTRPELRGWEWHYLNRLCQPGERFKLTGPGEWVRGASFSPNGKWIAAVSSPDNWTPAPTGTGNSFSRTTSVLVWDVDTRQSATLCEDIKECLNIAFSPDSRRLLIAQSDRVTVWGHETRTRLVTIPASQKQRFGHAAFSPDGQRVVTVSYPLDPEAYGESGVMALWNAESGKEIWALPTIGSSIGGVSFSPDGRWLLVPFIKANKEDKLWERRFGVKIYDADTHAELLVTPLAEITLSVIFSPTGTRFITSSVNGTATVWKIRREGNRPVPDGSPVFLRGHGSGHIRYGFSPDGSRVVTGNNDGTVRIWDTETGSQLRVLLGHQAGVVSAAFSPDGKQVVSSSYDGTVRVWDAAAPDRRVAVQHDSRMQRAIANRTGDRILTVDYDRSVVWDVRTGKALPFTLPGGFLDVNFTPDGRQVACVLPGEQGPRTRSNKVGLFDAETGKLIREFAINAPAAYRPKFNNDGTLLLLQGRGRGVDLWNLQSGEHWELGERGDLKGFANAGFSPDGSKLWVEEMGAKSTTLTGIAVYDARTRQRLTTLETEALDYKESWHGAFNADNSEFLIVFASSDASRNECRVWNVATRKQVRSFPLDPELWRSVAFSPDAKRLVAGGANRAMIVDTETGNEVLTVYVDNWVDSAVFDPTGERVILTDWKRVLVLDGTPLPEPKK